MGQNSDTILDHFIKILRSDLNHLYDPAYLKKSPLVNIFALDDRFDAPFALQNLLTDAIEELKGSSSLKASPQFSAYNFLYQRYILQASQSEMATQLSVSIRQVRREQDIALRVLASYLWNKYNPENPLSDTVEDTKQTGKASSTDDLDWLSAEDAESVTDLNFAINRVSSIIQPLLAQTQTTLEKSIPSSLPPLGIHPTACEQALLSLLTTAIHSTQNQHVMIQVRLYSKEVHCQITTQTKDDVLDFSNKQESNSLIMAARLVNIFSGTLEYFHMGGYFTTVLSIPKIEESIVLVIDDNTDFFALMDRFCEGSAYKIMGISEPDNIDSCIQTIQPGIIILDIMMPEIDGWQLLREIKANSNTASVPVIISTILPQKDLAIALGADDFLQKPINKPGLLDLLDRWSNREK